MSTQTTSPILRRTLLTGIATAAVLVALQAPRLTPATDAAAAGPSLVGVWMSQVIDQREGKRIDIMTFSSDGLVLTAGALPVTAPTPPGLRRDSIGQGTWAHASGGGYDAQFVELNQNADGTFGGTTTIRSHVTLSADGNIARGRSDIVVEVGGHVVYTTHATVRATRITPPPA